MPSGCETLKGTEWGLTETELPTSVAVLQHHETLFCLGNGNIGVRGSLEEIAATPSSAPLGGSPRRQGSPAQGPFVSSAPLSTTAPGNAAVVAAVAAANASRASTAVTYINGVFDECPVEYPHEEFSVGCCSTESFIVPVPEASGVRLFVGGEEFGLGSGELVSHTRTLDFKSATLTRKFTWRTTRGRREVTVESTRFVSQAKHRCVAIQYRVTAVRGFGAQSGSEIRLISTVKEPPRRARSEMKTIQLDATVDAQGIAHSVFDVRTGRSRVGISCVGVHECSQLAASPLGTSTGTGGGPSFGGGSLPLSSFATHAVGGSSALPLSPQHPTAPEAFSKEERRVAPTVTVGGHSVDIAFSAMMCDRDQITFRKFIAYTTSLSDGVDEDSVAALRQELTALRGKGFPDALAAHQEAMTQFWRTSDVEITGCLRAQSALRFNMLHLFMSAGRNERTNIPSKGLTGELFNGHYSWDSEIFMFPFFVFTNVAIARSMIRFRIRTLGDAEDRARDLRIARGALYPVRTITGTESAVANACTLQFHINADIAYAIQLYYQVTGDVQLLLEGAAKVVLATALVWIQWGTWEAGDFHLRHVTGPDEYAPLVHDNYYTNSMSQNHLRFAVDLATLLQQQHPQEWARIAAELSLTAADIDLMRSAAKGMFLPYDGKRHIHLQHESFLTKLSWNAPRAAKAEGACLEVNLMEEFHPLTIYRHSICKQAEILLCQTLLGDRFTPDDKMSNFAFYEPLTTKDSSLTPGTISVAASEIRDMRRAYDYFELSMFVDVDNVVGNTGGGIHAAAMAGSWNSVVRGFAGMRMYNGILHFNPYLPSQWDSYSFVVRVSSVAVRVEVNRRSATYMALDGATLRLVHAGQTTIVLSKGKQVAIPLRQEITNLKFDAVIFDLSAVIQSTDEHHFASWKVVLDEVFSAQEQPEARAPLSKEQYLLYIRDHSVTGSRRFAGLQKLFQQRGIVVPYGTREDPPEAKTLCAYGQRKTKYFEQMVAQHGVSARPGVLDLMNDLRAHGVAIGLVSCSRSGRLMMNALPGLTCDCMVDATDAVDMEWKPEAEYFLLCARKRLFDPSRIVVIIDSVAGFSKSSLQQFCFAATTDDDVRLSELPHGVDAVFSSYTGLTTGTIDQLAENRQLARSVNAGGNTMGTASSGSGGPGGDASSSRGLLVT